MTMKGQSQTRRLDRRSVIAGAAALIAGAGAAGAQQPAKGPRVWLDMDQNELDDAYDQSKYAPNIAQVLRRYTANSEVVRARLGAPQRVAYGPSPIEMLDIFRARSPNAPVVVFIHGGAWRGGPARDYAFPAENFVPAGAHFVLVAFLNVIAAGGGPPPRRSLRRRRQRGDARQRTDVLP